MPVSWHQKAEEEPPSRFRAVSTRKFPNAPGAPSPAASSFRVREEETPMHHLLPPSVAMKVR